MKADKPIAIVLAGGKGTRLGGADKGLLQIDGHPLIELCIANLLPQTGKVIISANRNLSAYGRYADIVVPDTTSNYPGPLSGILSVMNILETEQRLNSTDVLTVPCDMPLLPPDLVARLYRARGGIENRNRIVAVHDGRRVQPLCALLPWSAKHSLAAFLNAGRRRASDWIRESDALLADFSDSSARFVNVNTQDDVLSVSAQLHRHD